MDNIENGYEIIRPEPTENAFPDSMRNTYLAFVVGDKEYGAPFKSTPCSEYTKYRKWQMNFRYLLELHGL